MMTLEHAEIELIKSIAESKRLRQSTLETVSGLNQLASDLKREAMLSDSLEDEQRSSGQLEFLEHRLTVLRRGVELLSGTINHCQRCLVQIDDGDRDGAQKSIAIIKRLHAEFWDIYG